MQELVARASALGCAPLCDALGRDHTHRLHIHDLVGPPSGAPLFGPAVTIRFLPLRPDLVDPERHGFDALARRAAAGAPEGAVLVAAAGQDQPVAGGKKLALVKALGLAGLLTDGRVRDLAEADDLDVAVWARGEAVRNANDALMGWEADVAFDLAGATVVPGDWVYADRSGAVVVPSGAVEETLDAAEALADRDARTVADTLAGAPRPDSPGRG
ncbi:MAG: RraA family protein [Miltoncostaeaceae bacterium]